MKSVFGFFLLMISIESFAWQVTVSCVPHSKSKVEVEELILKNTDGKSRESSEDVQVAGIAKKIVVNKKTFKDVSFKGQRSQSIKGSYYTLETFPEHRAVKVLKITGSLNDDVGKDELLTVDGKSYSITCTEIEVLDCSIPEKPEKIPKDSIWAGGCDGGAWIQVVELKGKRAKLKIYFSESGEVWKDGWFEFTENCHVKSKDVLKTDLSSFDGEMVHLRRVNPKVEPPQNCYLKSMEK